MWMICFLPWEKLLKIDEKLMDAATVLGPAARLMPCDIYGRISREVLKSDLMPLTASLIAAQTVKGAAELLLQKGTHPEQEIDKVTTPKGCTIAGLNEMEHQGFSSSSYKGIGSEL